MLHRRRPTPTRERNGHVDESAAFFKAADSLPRRHQVDVVEICGGEGGVSRISLRRHLAVGQNFDLRSGIDLTDPKQQQRLIAYIREHKPLFVIMAPPCSSFGSWSHYNRVHAK